jgi:periplasmic glucans biosynthesis protein
VVLVNFQILRWARLAVFAGVVACLQAEEFPGWAELARRAEALASAPFVAVPDPLPPALAALTYDRYREIEFRVDQAWWRDRGADFRLTAFHRGGLARDRVGLHEFAPAGGSRELAFSTTLFNYRAAGEVAGLSADLGFAGFRLLHPLNTPGVWDEAAAFLGASYFRVAPRGAVYGLSARGLAVDSGMPERREEFPAFREFHFVPPKPGDRAARFLALLDSPRVTGAYAFTFEPGADSVMTVQVRLHPRERLDELGLAPLTSMFWYGEQDPRPAGEHRPEVHDSDGLWLAAEGMADAWVPCQQVGRVTHTEFRVRTLRGFGLLQRDREHASYRDNEAQYHRRPSAWVEPLTVWGAGRVRLVELVADKEYGDNIVAYWRPDVPAAAGIAREYSYRLTWSLRRTPLDPR